MSESEQKVSNYNLVDCLSGYEERKWLCFHFIKFSTYK